MTEGCADYWLRLVASLIRQSRRQLLLAFACLMAQGLPHSAVPAMTGREYKILSDIADAQAIFAARQRLGEDVIGYAHAVKIDALAALGELMAQAPKAKRGAGPGRGKVGIAAGPTFNEPPTLRGLGSAGGPSGHQRSRTSASTRRRRCF